MHNFAYSDPNVAFDKVNDRFNLIYGKSDRINSISRIFFQTKAIDTKIMDNGDWIMENYALEQNYPNPFNNETNIEFRIKNNSEIQLNVYNSNGQFVQELVNEKQGKGKYKITFQANKLNSGIYYYQLVINGINEEARKMMYLR